MKQRVNSLTIIFISCLLCLFMAGSALSECPPDDGGGGGGGGGTENSSSSNGTGGGAGPIGGSGSPGGSGSDGGGSSATGNNNYDPSWSLEYATGNPTKLSPGKTAEITVLNGYQNFLWTISSEDESLVFVENGSTELVTSKRTVTVRASDDVACKTTATIVVKDAYRHTDGTYGDTDVGEIDISPSLSLEWDTVNSAKTISANGSCQIAVVEQGGGPYLWEVTGGSAYFNSARTQSIIETTSSSTTLYADNACGPISIKVTDACELETIGYLRAPGRWESPYCDWEKVPWFALTPGYYLDFYPYPTLKIGMGCSRDDSPGLHPVLNLECSGVSYVLTDDDEGVCEGARYLQEAAMYRWVCNP